MSEEASALFLCPGCGAFVSEESDKCPNCGADLDESEDDVELELDELIEEGKDKCPKCGTEMPSDGSACKKCAAKKEDVPDETPDISDPKPDDEAGVALFLCSECGAFTAETEKECSNCGALLDQDAEDLTPEPEVSEAIKTEKDDEDNIYSMLELVTEEPEQEPEVKAEPEISDEDEEMLDKLKQIERPDDVESLIESFSDENEDDISLEDLELGPGLDDKEPEKADLDNLLVDLESTDAVDFVQEELEPVETVLKGDIDIKPSKEGDGELAICAECGAFVSPDQEKCGVCDAN